MGSGTVTVFGGTGTAGGGVVRAMLDAGWNVRAVTRDTTGDKARAVAALGAEPVAADMEDRVALRAAIGGSDAVYFSGPSLQDRWDIGQAIQGIMVAESVREVGTGHFIYQSAQAGGSRGVLSVGGKRAIEERIAELHLDATILRPGWFMDNFLTYFPVTENDGTLVVAMAMPTDVPLALVCSDDIGRAAAAVFARPDAYRNAEIDLVADVGSTAQMAATIGEIAGKPAVAVEVPMAAIEEHWPQGVDLYKWLATKPAENDTGPLTALVGSPIGFHAWAQEKLAPALPG
ncbi:NmrA family NAD(P)-binding protein [Novosphingobium colocasiae]|uniref:NmrA family NAD(P)-binding protein n=1 Tax=Novosphingobium colocasiae TaxID=1256513 RepID=UPI0035B148AA